MSHIAVFLGLAVGAAGLSAAGGTATAASSAPHVISDIAIGLTQPSDVRWSDDDHIVITDIDRGLARIDVSTTAGPVVWLPEWPAPHGPGSRYFHLAYSDAYAVASDFAFGAIWLDRKRGQSAVLAFEYVADVDADDSRLLISGLRRDVQGQLGADGAMAWLGSLTNGIWTLRPVLPFGKRKAIEGCAGFGLGVVRFLSNGGFIIVPGSEPGVYVFNRQGHLEHVWPTNEVGVDVNCDFSREQQAVLSTSDIARQQWVNRHAIIDEVVETPSGPALIVRRVGAIRTDWFVVLLNAQWPTALALPISSPSPWAHVTAAVRGGRIAILISDREATTKRGAPPRLVLLRWGTP